MDTDQTLLAYKAMQNEILSEYQSAAEKVEKLKAAGKTKTVSYKEAWAARYQLEAMLDRYRRHGLLE